jgi:hypothetical protein
MSLRTELLALVDRRPAVALAEGVSRREVIEQLPAELFEMADAMSSNGSDSPLQERLHNLEIVTREAVKLAEGQANTEAFARRFAMPLACVNALHRHEGTAPGDRLQNVAAGASRAVNTEDPAPMTFAEARPDVMLARMADEIHESEGVDYGTAIGLAEERDPMLAFRYRDASFLRENTRASRADIEPPRGLKLCECPPDVELAERGKALAAAEGITFAAAMDRLLKEDVKLATRYHDRRMGENALDELAYRATTIREASRWRMSERKAMDAALAEDPKLKEAVLAYFEPNPYQPTT